MARKSIDFAQSLSQFQRRNSGDNKESEPEKVKNHQNLSTHPEIEDVATTESALTTKYKLQNKSLARSNSAMMRKMNEMDTKLNVLINENMKLRKNRTLRDNEFKKQLEEKIDLIETRLFQNFSSIFQYMKEIRQDEGLAANPQLDVLKDINCLVTSTPIESDLTLTNPFGVSRSEPVKAKSFFDDHLPRNTPSVEPTEPPNIDEKSPLCGKSTARTTNKEEESIENQTFIEEGSDNAVKCDGFSVILEDKEPSNDVIKVPTPEPTPVPEPKKDVVVLRDSESPEIKQENEPRARRTRKKVDYTPVPLRAKMRRESEKFLDAVGENVLINYAVSKKPEKRKSDEEETARKRKPLGNISNTNIAHTQPQKSKENDLSVFDFEKEAPRRDSVYLGRKSARKNRRQTLM